MHIPLKVWVWKITRCICMSCWQASLWEKKTPETLQLFNFWNPFLYISCWSCLQISQAASPQNNKIGHCQQKKSILNTSVRKQAHLKTRLKKRSYGRFEKPTKSSHMNACVYLFWNWYTADYHKLAFRMIHAHCISHSQT